MKQWRLRRLGSTALFLVLLSGILTLGTPAWAQNKPGWSCTGLIQNGQALR